MKVRASEAERAEWHAKTRFAGLTLSDLVRRAVGRTRTWTVAHAEVERERTQQVARVGNNLNQIARWANTHREAVEAVEVIGHLIAIRRALAALAPRDDSMEDDARRRFSPYPYPSETGVRRSWAILEPVDAPKPLPDQSFLPDLRSDGRRDKAHRSNPPPPRSGPLGRGGRGMGMMIPGPRSSSRVSWRSLISSRSLIVSRTAHARRSANTRSIR